MLAYPSHYEPKLVQGGTSPTRQWLSQMECRVLHTNALLMSQPRPDGKFPISNKVKEFRLTTDIYFF